MNEQLNRYEVKWQTKTAPACTFYKGKHQVWAEDDEEAVRIAQNEIQRNMFREFSPEHIIITQVTRNYQQASRS